jgi:hypothetical protein
MGLVLVLLNLGAILLGKMLIYIVLELLRLPMIPLNLQLVPDRLQLHFISLVVIILVRAQIDVLGKEAQVAHVQYLIQALVLFLVVIGLPIQFDWPSGLRPVT